LYCVLRDAYRENEFSKQSQFSAGIAVWPQSFMDYLENLCAFAPSWQKHIQKCTNFYKYSQKCAKQYPFLSAKNKYMVPIRVHSQPHLEKQTQFAGLRPEIRDSKL